MTRKLVSRKELKSVLRAQAAKCAGASLIAKQALAHHIERSQTLVSEAETAHRSAKARYDQIQSKIDTRVAEAHDVEKETLTPDAAVVLSSLLASDRGAWWRYQSFRALLIAIELLPLLLMTDGKRSVSGVRVGIDREIAMAKLERLREAVLEEHLSESSVQAMMTGAMQDALASPIVRQHAMRHFQSRLDLLIPIDVAKRLIAELESSASIVERTARTHPTIAQTVTEIWTQAMSEIIATLRGRATGPAQPWAIHRA
jgi:hypothetical protein